MKGLTPRQRELLNYISEYIETHAYAPSYREIMQHFGLSSLGPIHKHIQVLKRKGHLQSEHRGHRSLAPTEMHRSKLQNEITLPFIGNLIGGFPIETFSQVKMIAVPESLVHAPERTYVLQAKGEHLNEELIAAGDFLIVEARQTASTGETIVALINQRDTVVKRYFHEEGDYVRLAGLNPHLKPLIFKQQDVHIQGVVTGLMRLFH